MTLKPQTLQDLRARVLAGSPPTDEEMWTVVEQLVKDRQQAVAKAQEKARSKYYDLDSLFSGT